MGDLDEIIPNCVYITADYSFYLSERYLTFHGCHSTTRKLLYLIEKAAQFDSHKQIINKIQSLLTSIDNGYFEKNTI